MHFFVTHEDPTKEEISVILQRGRWTLFYVILPEKDDTVSWWLYCFQRLYLLPETDPDHEQLENLLDAIMHLLEIPVAKADYETYLHVLEALFRFLDSSLAKDLAQVYSRTRERLSQVLFQFKVEYPESNDRYVAVFSSLEYRIWELPLLSSDDAYLPEVSQTTLVAHCRESEGIKHIHYFIENYQYFQANIAFQASLVYQTQSNKRNQPNQAQNADQMRMKQNADIFTCLSRALVALIKQDTASLGIYAHLVPEICGFIVKNELEDVEVHKAYLEPILNSRESEKKKEKRLTDIVNDIKGDIQRRLGSAGISSSKQASEEEDERLMQVISLISDHYLRHYNLDCSIKFWKMIDNRDRILGFLLHFHKRPYIYLMIQGLALLALFILMWLHWIPAELPHTFNLFERRSVIALLHYLTLLPLLVFFLPLLLFIIIIPLSFRKKMRLRWLYSQLLLPRILGAAVVGLLPLLLSTQSWFIGIESRLIPEIMLLLLTGVGSFIYVFVEVHKTIKFIPDRSLQMALRESRRIFCIALSETLFLATVASTLISPAVLPSLSGLSEDRLGIIISLGPWLTIGFFPSLILLWTGIALFIGSFVQLLWQDRRITETV